MSRAALPLAGLRVAVTRPTGSAGPLAEALRSAGAEPVVAPLSRIAPPADAGPLRDAMARLDRYDWIVFTSANAVRAAAPLAAWDDAHATRIAAVGDATAAAVRELAGREAHIVPPTFSGDALATAMLALGSLRDARVLWPRAANARHALPRALLDAGARLDDPIAYRTQPDRAAADALSRLASAGRVNAITFAAPSAVHCYAAATPPTRDVIIAVIGPETAAAARGCGLKVHVTADVHTAAGLVDALIRFQLDAAAG